MLTQLEHFRWTENGTTLENREIFEGLVSKLGDTQDVEEILIRSWIRAVPEQVQLMVWGHHVSERSSNFKTWTAAADYTQKLMDYYLDQCDEVWSAQEVEGYPLGRE